MNGVETRTQKLPWNYCQAYHSAENLTTHYCKHFGSKPCHVSPKWNSVTANVNTQDGECEAERCEETSRSGGRTPEAVQDGIEEVPLIPVGLSKLALHCSRGTDAEEEYECLASKYRRHLSPSGILGAASISRQIRLVDQKG